MGDAKRKQTETEKLIAQFPDCYFCGGLRRAVQREHMPPKSLFDGSHRPDKLVMPVCDNCNKGTSTADLVAAIISRWTYNPSVESMRDYEKFVLRAAKQAPELVQEWRHGEEIGCEVGRRHLNEHGVRVPKDASIMTIGTLTTRQLNIFAHKATLALYFETFKRPLSSEGAVCSYWRSKEDFMVKGIPSDLLAMMPRHRTLIQGSWNTIETFEYRWESNDEEGLFGCFARLRQGLFILGFAIPNIKLLNGDVGGWTSPAEPSILINLPQFQKKG